MQRFVKRPVVVEAIQYKPHENCEEIARFLGQEHHPVACQLSPLDVNFVIMTNEGEMQCSPGDWIIKEPFPTGDRRFYPCKPDIFDATYERVVE